MQFDALQGIPMPRAQGVGAISGTRNGPSWLALPARDAVGSVRVYDMHLAQSVVQAELRAHKTPLVRRDRCHGVAGTVFAAMAWLCTDTRLRRPLTATAGMERRLLYARQLLHQGHCRAGAQRAQRGHALQLPTRHAAGHDHQHGIYAAWGRGTAAAGCGKRTWDVAPVQAERAASLPSSHRAAQHHCAVVCCGCSGASA